jgi:hypothetical protein
MRSTSREEPVSAGAAASFPALLLLLAGLAVAVCLVPHAARASYRVAVGAASPALRVDAKGYAEVSWTSGGARHTLLVRPDGGVQYNDHLLDADVSTPASGVDVPSLLVLRKTPDGSYWALQSWQLPGGPAELHLAHWKGEPTQLTLAIDPDSHLGGTASFQGKPVHGLSAAPGGKHSKVFVYLDCSGCPIAKAGWGAMLGVAPAADGSFRVYVQSKWVGAKYRAEVAGQNSGTTWAPDASVTVSAG